MALASAEEYVNLYNGRLFQNRLIRAQKQISFEILKRLSFSQRDSRYFETNNHNIGDMDISVKCHQCGQVGHKAIDCINEAIPIPCHLCAGVDHDPGK
jgi:hypothetical protein